MGFFNKNHAPPAASDPDKDLEVSTIPGEFYGGQSPVIRFKGEREHAEAVRAAPPKAIDSGLSPASKSLGVVSAPQISTPVFPSVPAIPSKSKLPVSAAAKANTKAMGFFSNRLGLFLVAGGLFLIVVLGASWYYWQQSRPKSPPKQTPVVTPPVIKITPPTTTVVVPPPVIETPATSVETSTPPVYLQGGPMEFPSILLGDSADTDHDHLTDAEEELLNTDPAKPDTDSDGYPDATEVFYLYSPTSKAPAKLIDTPVVKEFTNPMFAYKIYYPTAWASANVDPDYRDMLFSTITGENVELRVFDRAPNQKFQDWFATAAPGEQLSALRDFSTAFKSPGLSRSDSLVYYYTDAGHFYVLLYHTTASNVVNYRAVFTMMGRSFRPSIDAETPLPPQQVFFTDTSTATTSP